MRKEEGKRGSEEGDGWGSGSPSSRELLRLDAASPGLPQIVLKELEQQPSGCCDVVLGLRLRRHHSRTMTYLSRIQSYGKTAISLSFPSFPSPFFYLPSSSFRLLPFLLFPIFCSSSFTPSTSILPSAIPYPIPPF